jgi:hypothetical protein
MNLDAKFLAKYLQTKFNNTLKSSYTMMKLVSFQGCKDGSTYANQNCNIAQKQTKDKSHMTS